MRRPPVVLLHGIWSNSEKWDNFIDRIQQTSPDHYMMLAVDYSYLNAESFFKNRNTTSAYISSALRQFKSKYDVATVQCDVVAHSMGGMLTRWYMSEELPHLP
ncbi:MAG: alpha/beta hydrolase [Proteobacteria bacterium]|nr:alpha/beta hydrolase [Pseudomonadota bacterium]